jgi:hypothetical protein
LEQKIVPNKTRKTSDLTIPSKQLYIKKFPVDFENIHYKNTLIIGRDEQQKTQLLLDCMCQLQNYKRVVCISPSQLSYEKLSEHIPEMYIHRKYTPELMMNVLKIQKKLRAKYNHSECEDIDSYTLIIFNDCIHDSKWQKDVCLRELWFNQKAFRTTIIMIMQYPAGICPIFRVNMDNVFMIGEERKNNIKKFHEYYGSVVEKYLDFEKIYNTCVENGLTIAIKIHSNSNKIEDNIYWCKPRDEDKHFKMCKDDKIFRVCV